MLYDDGEREAMLLASEKLKWLLPPEVWICLLTEEQLCHHSWLSALAQLRYSGCGHAGVAIIKMGVALSCDQHA